jgi:hypothetical protein
MRHSALRLEAMPLAMVSPSTDGYLLAIACSFVKPMSARRRRVRKIGSDSAQFGKDAGQIKYVITEHQRYKN